MKLTEETSTNGRANSLNDGGSEELAKTLTSRHIDLITLGGIIGAGLFVGSSAAIATAGPAVILSYICAGALVFFVMRILGELAIAKPGLGSFADYVRWGLGNWAGFTAGWLFWYFWVIVIGIEAIAGAKLAQNFIDLPLWALGGILLTSLLAVNMASTRAFGEFEFWFASIKVAAIIAFILITGGYALGLGAGDNPTFSNLTSHGGFAPMGATAIIAGITTVIFSLTGAEIATVAAAESAEPSRAIARMTTTLVWRILIFYVASVFLITLVVPWDEIVVGQSPFAQAMGVIGIPAAETIMNLVVLTAVLSCLNSGLYVCSRILFGLAAHNDAPQSLIALNRYKVPVRSTLIAGVGGYLALAASILSPDGIFAFLVNACGATMLMIYILISAAHIKLRKELAQGSLPVWTPYLTIAGMVSILAAMLIMPDLRTQLLLSILSAAIVVICFWFRKKRNG